ncbi:MAG: metal ABC transporter solute-binding protein, Zn/Mn family [Roseinatronobacter sp.]
MTLTRRSVLTAFAASLALPRMALAADAPLSVVATTGMIADAARQVGGDLVTVNALMGPGIDPHAYRQTRSDIVEMTRADLVLWHGLYLEAQLESLLLDMGRSRTVIPVGEAVPEELRLADPDYDNRFDPHVWMDPDLWQYVVLAVRDALSAARPQQTELFAANAAAHIAALDGLSEYAAQSLASVPQEARVLLTAHDAFGYFGRVYGYEVLGIQGISTESEAGLNRIGELVTLLVDRQIGAVFVESSVSDRNIRALIEGAAARGHTVRVGGELFSDAMGPDGTYEGTYIGMIDHNVTMIAGALGGDVPPRGLNDQLSAGL